MGIIAASILTIFLNKQESNKILAAILILYVIFLNFLSYNKTMVLQDYINCYSFSTILVCLSLFVYTNSNLTHFLIILSIILPQVYYIALLYKPYLLSNYIPFWWLSNVDMLFKYSVFFLFYEQSMNFSFKDMKFKEFMFNFSITIVLVLF